ncbi:MAG: methylated-DNA--[protein]-cysteine S-methyltransferase [bacterium]|nr:MAG: methylated-DNA--[protein]-cysteine S-methyltransferase [bacterium]
MTSRTYFTVSFEKGKVVVHTSVSGSVGGVEFDLEGKYPDAPSTSSLARDLGCYFRGEVVDLKVPIDLSRETPFRRKVYLTVMGLERGVTATYGEVARLAGSPGGARAVGQAMAANRYPLFIPCHRVVAGSGELGGFSSGRELKRYLLRLEGLAV